jgi:DNA polymerase-3 subunit gamma/tau
MIGERRDVSLKLDVERFVRPVAFQPGAITFEAAPGAPADLAQRLSRKLKEWTGQAWLVAAEGGGGAESAYERERRERTEVRQGAENDPFVRSLLETFPGAEIVDVRVRPTPTVESDAADDT